MLNPQWFLFLIAVLGFAPAVFGQTPIHSEYELLQKLPLAVVEKMRGGKPDANGMVGHNQEKGYLGAEYQRGTMETLIAGAVAGNKDWIEEGFRVVDATFARQDAKGGFGDKAPTGGAFWITALARAFLVLQDSPYGKEYHGRMKAYYPQIHKALKFLSKNRDKLVRHDGNTPNRLFIDADAFFLCSKLFKKDAYLDDARYLQGLGLKLYDESSGAFLENGGGDTSYQAVNLLMLLYYDLYYPSPDIEKVIQKAEAWELSKLKPDGTLDVSTNSRTGKGQEIYFGKPKGVNYPEAMQMFNYYGVLFNDPAAINAAQSIKNRPKE